MSKVSIYPSILALIDHPETWIERVKALPVPLAGIQYDVGDGWLVLGGRWVVGGGLK
jgi:hypothetical protein